MSFVIGQCSFQIGQSFDCRLFAFVASVLRIFGEVAIADTQNQVVRLLESSGAVNTTAGGGPANTLTLQLIGSPSSVYGSGSITAALNCGAPRGSLSQGAIPVDWT